MKPLILILLSLFSLAAVSQNMVYFERQSPFADFTSGNGIIKVQKVGVSSSLTILIKYKKLVGGTPVSTGWITHTGASYNDIYDDTIYAVGVYQGDTLIRSKHLFDPNNYEIIDATASGFDEHGLYDYNYMLPWEIVITFDGPTSNSDAEVTTGFFGGVTTSTNNVLTLDETISPFPPFNNPVLYNDSTSQMFIRTSEVNNVPNHQSGTLLNAYIPRVTSRPNTIDDCGGEIAFERVSLVNDITLEYSINGAPYTTLSNDVFTGLCAYDTIAILGFSPTVLNNDTLVETQYVLRSTDSIGPYDFDMSLVGIDLNLNNTSDYGCENTLTFSHYQGAAVSDSYGLLFNDLGEILTVTAESGFNEYGDICQAKYMYSSIEFGANPSPLTNYYRSSYFTLTILDEYNEVHGNPVNTDIYQTFTDSLTCTSDLIINRVTSPAYSQNLYYTTFVSNFPNTYEDDATVNGGIYSDSITFNGICPGMYTFNHDQRRKFVFVTDSLQQLDVSYYSLIGNGIDDNYVAIPKIDTLKLFYEECDNDYSQPFTTVDYYKTNSQVSTVNTAGSGFNIEEFNSSFDLTQGTNSFYLHERPVTMIDYSSYPNPTPYYIVTELYCESSNKSTIKRRKLIIAPDGTVTDIYDDNLSNTEEIMDQTFTVYPNPSSENITIKSDEEWRSYKLFNLNGVVVLEGQNPSSQNTFTINIQDLESGTYVIQIIGKDSISKKLIVKQ